MSKMQPLINTIREPPLIGYSKIQ